jgi:alcohol dehydrogenase class IV
MTSVPSAEPTVRRGPSGFDVVVPSTPRIVSGVGTRSRVPELLADLGATRTLLVTSPSMAAAPVYREVVEALGGSLVGRHETVRPHAPMDDIRVLDAMFKATRADSVVSVGGASVIDTTKALVSLNPDRRCLHLTMPALFGGAEVTPFAGVTRNGEKRRLAGPELIPRVVVLDPAVPAALPIALTTTSLGNALSHCVGGLFSVDANPFSDALYLRAAALTAGAAVGLGGQPSPDAFRDAQSASVLAALLRVRMGIGHALVHAISPVLGCGHAATHAIVMRVVAHRRRTTLDADRRHLLVNALASSAGTPAISADGDALVESLTRFLSTVRIPLGLAGLGIPWDQVESALPRIDLAARRDLEEAGGGESWALEPILRSIWSGDLSAGSG